MRKKLTKAYLLFLLGVVWSLPAYAQDNLEINGVILDAETNLPLPGATIVVKGTSTGTVADFDGNFSIKVANDDAVLIISYIGFSTKEITVNGQRNISVALEESTSGLDEVVVVGYGTKKKVNLTGAVSVIGEKVLEDRPVANVQQALQGVSPNLQITTSVRTGEPGAQMSMNIRGLTSIEGNSSPFVLVDGIPMGINDIDPNDIKSISVLKDVAASAIYGARAAYGVILITTKSGKQNTGVNISYSSNFGVSSMINMPEYADALSFAQTMNQARINVGAKPFYDEAALDRITQNMADPGSAPEVLPTPNGLAWDLGVDGLNASAATDWESLVFKKSTSRMKHNLNVSGGGKGVTFYLSGGYYDEDGLMKQAKDYFKRYNIDAKIAATVTPWMDLSFLTKYKYEEQEYTTSNGRRSFVMLLMTRLKPTKPAFYPGTDIWTGRIGEQVMHKTIDKNRQLVLSPRMTLEPIKDWVTNIELNYRTNDNRKESDYPTVPQAVPDGKGGSTAVYPNQGRSRNWPNMYSNSYLSPNIYSEYKKSFGKHNFYVMAGYQQETYNYFNLLATAKYLLTNAVPSISTSVGEKTITDSKGHWATQGVFGRFNYSYDEKYLMEMNIRRDGSSRFEPDERWGTFPSFSAGWNISKESFYPLKDQIEFFKIRGSYGTIGNQNVSNYLYVPTLPVGQSNWLFGGERLWTVGTPNLSSVDLTWEEVKTIDFGVDIQALDNRLGFTFDWYKSRTTNLVGPGRALPVILGTNVPKQNDGEVTTKGWETEISWRTSVNEFSYGIKGVLSDYNREITRYNNPTNILNTHYKGKELGEIWGFETAGLYQSEDDIASWPVDQSFIYSGTWFPGDVKYVDQNGDNKIDLGDNTKENPGDKKVIGNNTPRYQFGLSADFSWKGIDASFLIQGVGKRDLDIRALGTFRGPSNGGLQANVFKEHLDFWRDDSSPLGANPDAYFPRPYTQFTGQNNKNYRFPTTRYLQNGAYVRLKNIQVGYTIPRNNSQKAKIPKVRMYLSAENLLTFTDLMIYDPESFNGDYPRIGDQYPLSRVISLGLNINF